MTHRSFPDGVAERLRRLLTNPETRKALSTLLPTNPSEADTFTQQLVASFESWSAAIANVQATIESSARSNTPTTTANGLGCNPSFCFPADFPTTAQQQQNALQPGSQSSSFLERNEMIVFVARCTLLDWVTDATATKQLFMSSLQNVNGDENQDSLRQRVAELLQPHAAPSANNKNSENEEDEHRQDTGMTMPPTVFQIVLEDTVSTCTTLKQWNAPLLVKQAVINAALALRQRWSNTQPPSSSLELGGKRQLFGVLTGQVSDSKSVRIDVSQKVQRKRQRGEGGSRKRQRRRHNSDEDEYGVPGSTSSSSAGSDAEDGEEVLCEMNQVCLTVLERRDNNHNDDSLKGSCWVPIRIGTAALDTVSDTCVCLFS